MRTAQLGFHSIRVGKITNQTVFTSLSVFFAYFLPQAMFYSRAQSCMLAAGYLAYLLMGALIFQVLEKDAERLQQGITFRMKEDFLKNFTSLSAVEVNIFVEVGHSF